jgi:hypothetical protein
MQEAPNRGIDAVSDKSETFDDRAVFSSLNIPSSKSGSIAMSHQVTKTGMNADSSIEAASLAGDSATVGRTKLKRGSPAFTPVSTDTRLDSVTYAVYVALVSSGQSHQVRAEKGTQGVSPTLMTVQLQNGPNVFARCYEIVHLARQVLEDVTSRLTSVVLLSKRVQKEEYGYSLRSSIACIPCSAEGSLCWDLFKTGSCPRRNSCQWYHPQESDIGRLKISVRASEEATVATRVEQPAVKHTISLGNLVQ